MNNIDFPDMVLVASALLHAGAQVSEASQKSIKRAAETFEFHRSGFAADSVEKVSAACQDLCEMFGVEPPPKRLVHDGTSPIIATADTVGARHEELWNLLVPSRGACATVQGEVIRISGRIADEWYRNGGVNWDRDYAAMAHAFCAHVRVGPAQSGPRSIRAARLQALAKRSQPAFLEVSIPALRQAASRPLHLERPACKASFGLASHVLDHTPLAPQPPGRARQVPPEGREGRLRGIALALVCRLAG